jgi:enoyl-CoA hydratase/carnithine racemase
MVRDDVLRALTYSNREFSGSEALELGFATEINADPRARALELANEIAGKNPDAIREAKALFNEYADMDEDAILMAESVRQMNVIRKPNQIEAVMAAMQKRLPVFK